MATQTRFPVYSENSQATVLGDKGIPSSVVLPLFVQKDVEGRDIKVGQQRKTVAKREGDAVHFLLTVSIGNCRGEFSNNCQEKKTWIKESNAGSLVSHQTFVSTPRFFHLNLLQENK